MTNKKAADITVEEFAIELMLMWDDLISIPDVKRDKNNRSYIGRITARRGAQTSLMFSPKAKLSMNRGKNNFNTRIAK